MCIIFILGGKKEFPVLHLCSLMFLLLLSKASNLSNLHNSISIHVYPCFLLGSRNSFSRREKKKDFHAWWEPFVHVGFLLQQYKWSYRKSDKQVVNNVHQVVYIQPGAAPINAQGLPGDKPPWERTSLLTSNVMIQHSRLWQENVTL